MSKEKQKKFCKLLKSRNVDLHTCIGIAIILKTEENFNSMTYWIDQNKQAGQTEILHHMDTLVPRRNSLMTAVV